MNILLLGYGKMGKTIEAIALKRGHSIASRIDNIEERNAFTRFHDVDVAIEFSQPEVAVDNLKFCFDHSIPVVCGTTGWLEQKSTVDAYCKKKEGALFQASNFSLGVNLFFQLNEYLAKIMDRYNEYNVSIDETHHTQKKDAPSGTAITLAEGILKNLHQKDQWKLGGTSQGSEISIHSFRVDPDPGTHVIKYQSSVDEIEIKHKAHSREGFALGAVLVAEWIKGKKGVLTMKDFLGF
ncbi:MAG TPA: 4-hydroxy-tetrahydrodipicolinate reductase [Cyclobacteriaceae bacterium]